MFQRFPGDLQQETLLGVQHGRLFRRDLEKRCVKLINLSDKATVIRDDICIQRHVPAIGRNGGDGIAALFQQLPEFLRRGGISGKAAGHADHGNRFFVLWMK